MCTEVPTYLNTSMTTQVEIKLSWMANLLVNHSSCSTSKAQNNPRSANAYRSSSYMNSIAVWHQNTNREECFHFYQSYHAFHEPQGKALCDVFSGQPQMWLEVDIPPPKKHKPWNGKGHNHWHGHMTKQTIFDRQITTLEIIPFWWHPFHEEVHGWIDLHLHRPCIGVISQDTSLNSVEKMNKKQDLEHIPIEYYPLRPSVCLPAESNQ